MYKVKVASIKMGSIKHECIVSNTYISVYSLCSIENISLEVLSKKSERYHSQFRRGNFSRQATTYTTQL